MKQQLQGKVPSSKFKDNSFTIDIITIIIIQWNFDRSVRSIYLWSIQTKYYQSFCHTEQRTAELKAKLIKFNYYHNIHIWSTFAIIIIIIIIMKQISFPSHMCRKRKENISGYVFLSVLEKIQQRMTYLNRSGRENFLSVFISET